MKKIHLGQIQQRHTLSTIARSASLLGSCFGASLGSFAHAQGIDNDQIVPYDGTGGAGFLTARGTFTITASSALVGVFSITFSATCGTAGDGDRISCSLYTIQNSSSTVAFIGSIQGACSTLNSEVLTGSCASSATYGVNALCVNQTTNTVLNPDAPSTSTASITCS